LGVLLLGLADAKAGLNPNTSVRHTEPEGRHILSKGRNREAYPFWNRARTFSVRVRFDILTAALESLWRGCLQAGDADAQGQTQLVVCVPCSLISFLLQLLNNVGYGCHSVPPQSRI
jgi:hypothetical protein